MHVTIHRSGGHQGRYKARILAVADTAGDLVAHHLGGRLPAVHITLTDATGCAQLMQRAELQVVGGATLYERAASRLRKQLGSLHGYGATVLTTTGTLVLINGPRHQGDLGQLDRTLVHELAHAVQLNAPGARQHHFRELRKQYDNSLDSDADIAAYNRIVDVREHQARNLEALARRLPAS